jgi:hypothetical protein
MTTGQQQHYYEVVQPNETFRGKSYGEWAAEWWNWLVSENPDGAYSLEESPIVFLRANIDYANQQGKEEEGEGAASRHQTGSHYNRTGDKRIEISEETAILFPVVEILFVKGDHYPEDKTKIIQTESELRTLTRRDIDEQWTSLEATIKKKGQSRPISIVNNLMDYRAESPLFKLVVSDKNPLKDKMEMTLGSGTFDAVTDGYWILIKYLAASDDVPYQIHFAARGRSLHTGDQLYYSATYEILVRKKIWHRH